MRGLIAIIQFILHYLAWAGMALGSIAFLFGNFDRGWELLIGGISFMALKYVIGFVYLGLVKLFNKDKRSNTSEIMRGIRYSKQDLKDIDDMAQESVEALRRATLEDGKKSKK